MSSSSSSSSSSLLNRENAHHSSSRATVLIAGAGLESLTEPSMYEPNEPLVHKPIIEPVVPHDPENAAHSGATPSLMLSGLDSLTEPSGLYVPSVDELPADTPNTDEPPVVQHDRANSRPSRATSSMTMSGRYSLTDPSLNEPSADGFLMDQLTAEVASTTASDTATTTTTTSVIKADVPTASPKRRNGGMMKSVCINGSTRRKGGKQEVREEDDRSVSSRRSTTTTTNTVPPPRGKERRKKSTQSVTPGAVSVVGNMLDDEGSTATPVSPTLPARGKERRRLQGSKSAPIVLPGAVSVVPGREEQQQLQQQRQQSYQKGTSMLSLGTKNRSSSSLEHEQQDDDDQSVDSLLAEKQRVANRGMTSHRSSRRGGGSRRAAIMTALEEEEEFGQSRPGAISVSDSTDSTSAPVTGVCSQRNTMAAEACLLSEKERYVARNTSSKRQGDFPPKGSDIVASPSGPPSQNQPTEADGFLAEKLLHYNRGGSSRKTVSGVSVSGGGSKWNLSQRSNDPKWNLSQRSVDTEGNLSRDDTEGGVESKIRISRELGLIQGDSEFRSSSLVTVENTNFSRRSIEEEAAAVDEQVPGAMAVYSTAIDPDALSVWTSSQHDGHDDAASNNSSPSSPRGTYGFTCDVEFASVEVVQQPKTERSCIKDYKKWIIFGVAIVIIVGAIVGGVVGSSNGGSGSGEEPVLASPTLAPTIITTSAPSVAIATSTRWKNVILASSPDTDFNDPMSPQSMALDWMSTDPYSSTIVNDVALFQRFSLASLWYSTNGTAWSASETWLNVGGNECSWQGITCNGNLVQALVLSGLNMEGTVPVELCLLVHLERLDLTMGLLSGTITTNLAKLTKLNTIRLANNRLSGTIPTEIGQLSLLHSLVLESNSLIGTIPSEMMLLTGLTEFSARENQLTGAIPLNGSLSNLETLWLTNNPKLAAGAIPSQLFELTSLTMLSLGQCRLGGTIPSEVGALTKLTELDLSYNRLSGTIPTELVNAGFLDRISMQGNLLTGSVPFQICACAPWVIFKIDCEAISCTGGCCYENDLEKC